MIKAEWTNADALDLQPTCNQLATDTISRQAAIHALIWKKQPIDNGDGTMTITPLSDHVIKETLEALPSAQPEVVRCKDCRWWEDISSNTFAPEYHMCKRHVMTMTGMDFCSRPERRTNG